MASAPTSRLVARPGLVDRLQRGAEGPVTVVVAPAGSGKSALIRSWLESRGADGAAMVSVERGERDGQRFWADVVAQVRAAVPADVAVEALAPTPEHRGAAVVKRLLGALEGLEQHLVLVIDDLHEIAGPALLEELALLLDQLPETVHVVLASRRDPQLGLHRRQLEGGVTELRSADLCFGLEETRQLLSALGIALSDDGLALLHDRTEGWVAGLRLAALSLATHPDPERFVLEFSGSERTVAGYLLAEVLDSQPTDVRRLLVRSSILARVNGPLGDELTGGSGSERHLRALAEAGGFVIELDAARTWFRFHHLFADLLAAELRHTEPDAVPGLHRAASGWHAEHGDVVEAIAHAQAAGDHEVAVGLLIGHYFSLTLDGRQATAHALLAAFAPDSVATTPELATVVAADQLAEGSLDAAAEHLALADRLADAVPEQRRDRWAVAQRVTRLSLARRLGDFRSVQEEMGAADGIPEPHDRLDIAINADIRAMTLMNLGIVEAWSGRSEQGAAHLDEARELARAGGRPYLEVSCLVHRAQADAWTSFTHARASCEEAIALAERHGWGEDPVVAPALVTMATAPLQAGRLDDAERWLERADDTLRPELEPAVGFLLHMAHGAVAFARGRHAEAIGAYRDAERLNLALVTGSPLTMQLRCGILHARLGLGELAEVRTALGEMTEEERDTGEAREVRAALALAQDDAQAAVDALAPTLSGAAGVHHALVVVRSELFEALARDALGDSAAAERAVERALEVAEEDALVLPFQFTAVRELLERHPSFRTAHGAFIAEVLDVLAGKATDGAGGQPAEMLEPLSDAELRVLRLLPTNLSASGIADELYVSVNTVKTHMRHIYAKLDAHSRVRAVERGRRLGLLGHSTRRG